MRKRYITSHSKLSTLVLLIICGCVTSTDAKNNEKKESNIVCYAAQNKWICAPENKQELANKESKKINKATTPEINTSNVVIKQLSIPTFNSSPKEQPKNTIKPNNIEINPYKDLWSYQLIGVSNPQSAINFAFRKGLNKKDILIIKSINNNRDWWIVLFGLYKDKATGIEDKANFPESINKSWLRPLKNLVVNGYIDEY